MCIAVPARVLEIEDAAAGAARVDVRGTPRTINLGLLDARPGDWVLVSLGLAVERISEADAAETLRLLDELENESTGLEGIASRASDNDDGAGGVANVARGMVER